MLHERIKEAAEEKAHQEGVLFYTLTPTREKDRRYESKSKAHKSPDPPLYQGPNDS